MRMSTDSLGSRLKALRKARHKLTQQEVADEIGIARAFLAQIETDTNMPGRETLGALAAYYNVSIDYLQTGSAPAGQDSTSHGIDDGSQAALLRLWSVLDNSERRAIMDMIGAFVRNRNNNAVQLTTLPDQKNG